MRKKSIAFCLFALSFLLFKLPASAAEPNMIKLSDLEDGQILELSDEDTVLELDTDKTLTQIKLDNCDLTITGTGTLTIDSGSYEPYPNLDSYGTETITMNSGTLVSSKTLLGNFILNDGCIKVPSFGPSICNWNDEGFFTMNGGELDVLCLKYEGANSSININGGHLICRDHIYCPNLNISDELFIVSPWDAMPTNGFLKTESSIYYSWAKYDRDHHSRIINIIPKTEVIPVEEFSTEESSYTVDLWEDSRISYSLYPESASNQYISWSSSDPSVVAVYDRGCISGQGYGTATITATTEDGKHSLSWEVTVPHRSPDERKGLNLEFRKDDNGDVQFADVRFYGEILEHDKDCFISYDEENDLYTVKIEEIANPDLKGLSLKFKGADLNDPLHLFIAIDSNGKELEAGEDYFHWREDDAEYGIYNICIEEIEYYFNHDFYNHN